MRICFVSHSGKLGGAETVLLETIEILHEQGVECRAILPAIGEFSNRLAQLEIPFAILPVPWWMDSEKISLLLQVKSARRIAIAALHTAAQVWRWDCDIVYSNTITVCTGAFAAAILRKPHVWHIEEFGREDHGLIFHFGEPYSVRLLGYLSASGIALSHALKQKFKAYIEPSKISVIYPSMHIAIDRNERSRAKQSKLPADAAFRCVIVGQVAEGKRQEDAIQAVASLVRSGVDVELVIVGDGDPAYRQRLDTIVRQAGVQDRFTFVGQVPDASPFIANSNALLMCSRSEGFGRVTIEGMLAGKPVIGARSGASKELIQDGVTGLLYSVGDPRDLALKIRQLSENPGQAETFGKHAQEWATALFTKKRYLAEMSPILESLVRCTKSEVQSPTLSKSPSVKQVNQ
jgi:glycosyltransferase involved in cell wall biosynthesis